MNRHCLRLRLSSTPAFTIGALLSINRHLLALLWKQAEDAAPILSIRMPSLLGATGERSFPLPGKRMKLLCRFLDQSLQISRTAFQLGLDVGDVLAYDAVERFADTGTNLAVIGGQDRGLACSSI